MVKNIPAMQETQVPSLGRDDPLEKGMATHFSILAWKIPWTEGPAQSVEKLFSTKPVPGAEKVGDHYLRRLPKSPDSLEDQGHN